MITLANSLGADEWVLNKTLPPQQKVFQDLLAQLKNSSNPKFILAEIHDLMAPSAKPTSSKPAHKFYVDTPTMRALLPHAEERCISVNILMQRLLQDARML